MNEEILFFGGRAGERELHRRFKAQHL